ERSARRDRREDRRRGVYLRKWARGVRLWFSAWYLSSPAFATSPFAAVYHDGEAPATLRGHGLWHWESSFHVYRFFQRSWQHAWGRHRFRCISPLSSPQGQGAVVTSTETAHSPQSTQ